MNINLTDEQWNEMLAEGHERDGIKTCWIYFKREQADFEIYCEIVVENEKAVVTYTEANKGKECFYGDKEMVEQFCEYGNRRKLNDTMNECPRCCTPMIYHFNYCPKCGQILKWEGDEE